MERQEEAGRQKKQKRQKMRKKMYKDKNGGGEG